MGKKVFILLALLADGFETIEALTPFDVLHRCNIDVRTLSTTDSLSVRSSHGVVVEADSLITQADWQEGQAVVIPGGWPGYVNLCNSQPTADIVADYYNSNRVVAAICGGPTVLAVNGIARGSRITCHTGVRERMTNYIYTGQGVERDGNLLTAKGAGLSIDFALSLALMLTDKAIVDKVRIKMEIEQSCKAEDEMTTDKVFAQNNINNNPQDGID